MAAAIRRRIGQIGGGAGAASDGAELGAVWVRVAAGVVPTDSCLSDERGLCFARIVHAGLCKGTRARTASTDESGPQTPQGLARVPNSL